MQCEAKTKAGNRCLYNRPYGHPIALCGHHLSKLYRYHNRCVELFNGAWYQRFGSTDRVEKYGAGSSDIDIEVRRRKPKEEAGSGK